MNNSKLVSVLRTFSKNEMKEFEKFVTSPFFNRGRNYLPFLKELKRFYPEFDDEKMTPEYIFSRLYRGKKFNKQIIWNMNSGLMNIAEEFLLSIYLKENDFDRDCHIADEFSGRKLSKLYSRKLETMEQDLKRVPLSNLFFDYATQLELRKITLPFLEDQQQNAASYIVKKGEYAILYFLVTMSNVVTNMNYFSLLYNTKYETNIPYTFINNLQLDKIVEYARANQYEYADIMELYCCKIMLSMKPEETSLFHRFKELYQIYSGRFHKGEKENLVGDMINYCVYRLNSGDIYFAKMLFEVNLLQLKDIDNLKKKEIGKIFYIQVLRNALLIDEVDWVKNYIEKYTPYLKRSYQKTMRALADAFLALKLKDYNLVIASLSRVRFIDTRDKFYVRSLSIMAYYELGEISTLLYYIDSSRQFVNKNPSLGIMTRNNFNKFLIHMNKFLMLNDKNDQTGLEMLKNEIEKDKSIINGSWLIEKINELAGKNR